MEENCLHEAEGRHEKLQQASEEHARVWEANLVALGEYRHPRESGVNGGVRRLHSRLSYWEARAPVKNSLLRLRVELWRNRCARRCNASIGVGEILYGDGSFLSMVVVDS